MFEIRVLSREDVKGAVDIKQVLDAVETAYSLKSNGRTEVWPTVFYDFCPGKADMDIKSGYLKDEKIFGHKTVTWFGDNAGKGLPTLIGMLAVFDAETGAPVGIMDASYITGIRTGAAGAIGAKYLANKNSENLLIVGTGNQSIFQIAAVLTSFPKIKKVRAAAKEAEEAKAFISNVKERLKADFAINADDVVFEAAEDLEKAVRDSHIIITVTPSRIPVIKKEWIAKGLHISCIGADMEGKQEIESEIMKSAVIFVDDLKHCKEVGEIEIPLKQGVIKADDIKGEIGDLILGKSEGRKSEDEVTIFDATGMAILDIITAKIALKAAEDKNIGSKVNI